jgi:hypothetical protein
MDYFRVYESAKKEGKEGECHYKSVFHKFAWVKSISYKLDFGSAMEVCPKELPTLAGYVAFITEYIRRLPEEDFDEELDRFFYDHMGSVAFYTTRNFPSCTFCCMDINEFFIDLGKPKVDVFLNEYYIYLNDDYYQSGDWERKEDTKELVFMGNEDMKETIVSEETKEKLANKVRYYYNKTTLDAYLFWLECLELLRHRIAYNEMASDALSLEAATLVYDDSE